jgi:fatty acid synthase, animal type
LIAVSCVCVCDLEKQKVATTERRPVWFVYSGMGSQWAGMGRDLMRMERFRRSIQRCSEALKPVGYDLMKTLTEADEETFKTPLNSFVCMCAIQVSAGAVCG